MPMSFCELVGDNVGNFARMGADLLGSPPTAANATIGVPRCLPISYARKVVASVLMMLMNLVLLTGF
jgi:Na+/H+-translocating membrane pyrophosphatase